MTTARDICTQALKKVGVAAQGQPPSAETINDAFIDLNDMLAQWRVRRWFVFNLETLIFASTGAVSYSVGPGGNFNVALRPPRIQSAFLRQVVPSNPSPIDFPLTILYAREDYNRIAQKTLQTWPTYLWYDNTYPLGYAYPWPVIPASQYSLGLTMLSVLQQIASLNTVLSMPPEYEMAMKWSLIELLAATYQKTLDDNTKKIIGQAKRTLVKANAQIPLAIIDPALVQPTLYNIYSDRLY